MVYYNDCDKHAVAWLDKLMDEGLIPKGDIDDRSISEVQPGDLQGYTQCHFFAGIGGWPYALRLAGWPTDRPVWSGSCPCQPFSAAGKRKGQSDERHLWPEFARLIKACRPETIFGEQVASSEVVGTQLEASFVIAVQSGDYARANKLAKQLVRASGFHYFKRWLDGVSADLEAEGYACGAAVLGAHSVGAPHIRQRLYWVADAKGERVAGVGGECYGTQTTIARTRGHKDRQPFEPVASGNAWNTATTIPCADRKSRRVEPSIQLLAHGVPARVVRLRGYGNAIVPQVAAEFVMAYMDIVEQVVI